MQHIINENVIVFNFESQISAKNPKNRALIANPVTIPEASMEFSLLHKNGKEVK